MTLTQKCQLSLANLNKPFITFSATIQIATSSSSATSMSVHNPTSKKDSTYSNSSTPPYKPLPSSHPFFISIHDNTSHVLTQLNNTTVILIIFLSHPTLPLMPYYQLLIRHRSLTDSAPITSSSPATSPYPLHKMQLYNTT